MPGYRGEWIYPREPVLSDPEQTHHTSVVPVAR
jgi:hypothetical protein